MQKTKIREIMEQDAYICNQRDKIEEVMKYLAKKRVSGVPVVDDDMRVVGFISDGDVMSYLSRKNIYFMDLYEYSNVVFEDENFEKKLDSLMEKNVMELATKKVITVDVDEEIDKVASILAKKHIKKVPVLENGRLAGVASRSTIVRHIMAGVIETYESMD